VAGNDVPIRADQNRVRSTPFFDGSGKLRDLFRAVRSRIGCSRYQSLDGPLLNLDIGVHRDAPIPRSMAIWLIETSTSEDVGFLEERGERYKIRESVSAFLRGWRFGRQLDSKRVLGEASWR